MFGAARALLSVAGVMAALATTLGCADLMPVTTLAVPASPVSATTDEAVVVITRPSPTGSAGNDDKLPLAERYSVLRVIDERRHLLADLRFNEHAVVRLQPGTRQLFAYERWDGAREPLCTAALHADLAGGLVYAVLARQLEHIGSRKRGCEHQELLRALPDERAWFWRFTLESSRRVELLANRDRSVFIDAPWVAQAHAALGRDRLRGDEPPVSQAAFIAPDDGEPR